jgi:hypothetical protein
MVGRSRTLFYKWRNNFLAEGISGLKTRKRRCNPHNITPVLIEEVVIAVLDQFPAYVPHRIVLYHVGG